MANKLMPTSENVEAFVLTLENEARRTDSLRLIELMQAATGESPQMWGSNIIGFGSYHYRYESGREGDSCALGFSPRAQNFSLYLTLNLQDETGSYQHLLDSLGKHKLGKGCLYIKRLSDVNLDALSQLLRASLDALAASSDVSSFSIARLQRESEEGQRLATKS